MGAEFGHHMYEDNEICCLLFSDMWLYFNSTNKLDVRATLLGVFLASQMYLLALRS